MKQPKHNDIMDKFARELSTVMSKHLAEQIAATQKQLRKLRDAQDGKLVLRAIVVKAHHVRAHERPKHRRFIVAKVMP